MTLFDAICEEDRPPVASLIRWALARGCVEPGVDAVLDRGDRALDRAKRPVRDRVSSEDESSSA